MEEASRLIDNIIAELTDWRGKTFREIRKAILEADPEIIEELKWKGTPVWSKGGIICLAKAFKDKVKVTFYQGASIPDPDKVFNAELGGKQWRAIDFQKDDKVKEEELKKLVRAAIELNGRKGSYK
jgi:hypothetical protein